MRLEHKHSTLPWKTATGSPSLVVQDACPGQMICGMTGDYKRADDMMEADSAFIVKACNSHYELVEALGAVEDLIADSQGVYGLHLNGDPAPWSELTEGGRYEEWLIAIANARAALAKAKGES